MTKILFICHGNICRSTMAQYVLQDMVNKKGVADKFYIDSAATSYEEIGNGVHPGTKNKLRSVGINRIIGNDLEGKVYKLLSFAGESGDIADPWYTGDFDVTYDDVLKGCKGFLKEIGIQ